MRRLAIAVVLLAGCDEDRGLAADDTVADDESSSEGGADTFSDDASDDANSSSDSGGEYLPLYAECTESSECSDAEYGSGGRANYCIASTCVERVIDHSVTDWLAEEDGPSPCSDPDADPVLVSIPGVTQWAAICGLRGRVANGLGHCDVEGMSFVTWPSGTDEKLSSMTCWWAPLLSGTRGGDGCSNVVPQPVDGDILPKVCG